MVAAALLPNSSRLKWDRPSIVKWEIRRIAKEGTAGKIAHGRDSKRIDDSDLKIWKTL